MRKAIIACTVLHGCLLITGYDISSCEFSSSKPDRTIKTIGHSSDNQSVVVASGYLRYHDDNSQNFSGPKYIPLVFLKYDFEEVDLFGYHVLTLEANCAKIVLNFEDSGQDYIVDTTEVFLAVPNKGANVCTLENDHFVQEDGKHYSCDLSYTPQVCKINVNNKYTHVVDLILTKLEFEIFGSPEKAVKDQFTTSETTC